MSGRSVRSAGRIRRNTWTADSLQRTAPAESGLYWHGIAETKTQIERRCKSMAEMTEAAREARRAYKRAWNAKNRDKVKASQERYWERKAKQAQDNADAQKAGERQA